MVLILLTLPVTVQSIFKSSRFHLLLQMMESYLYLAVTLLLASSINGRAIDDLDNSILSNNNNDDKTFAEHDWVEISLAPPPKLMQPAGNSIELECEVTGSPQPTIHWIRGNNPHNIVSIRNKKNPFWTGG